MKWTFAILLGILLLISLFFNFTGVINGQFHALSILPALLLALSIFAVFDIYYGRRKRFWAGLAFTLVGVYFLTVAQQFYAEGASSSNIECDRYKFITCLGVFTEQYLGKPWGAIFIGLFASYMIYLGGKAMLIDFRSPNKSSNSGAEGAGS